MMTAALADKDAGGMLDVLAPAFDEIVFCQSDSPRAVPAQELRDLAAARGIDSAWEP